MKSSTRAGDRRTRSRRASFSLAAVYLVFAVVGLVGTWYFNLRFDGSGDRSYLESWFANAASSSAAVDVIVTAVVACVFYVREGVRIGWRWWGLVLVPFTFAVALAFTFPLFLALREFTLLRGTTRLERQYRSGLGVDA